MENKNQNLCLAPSMLGSCIGHNPVANSKQIDTFSLTVTLVELSGSQQNHRSEHTFFLRIKMVFKKELQQSCLKDPLQYEQYSKSLHNSLILMEGKQ